MKVSILRWLFLVFLSSAEWYHKKGNIKVSDANLKALDQYIQGSILIRFLMKRCDSPPSSDKMSSNSMTKILPIDGFSNWNSWYLSLRTRVSLGSSINFISKRSYKEIYEELRDEVWCVGKREKRACQRNKPLLSTLRRSLCTIISKFNLLNYLGKPLCMYSAQKNVAGNCILRTALYVARCMECWKTNWGALELIASPLSNASTYYRLS